MVACVVQDHHHAPTPSTVTQEMAKEAAKSDALKLGVGWGDQLSVAQMDRPKQGYRLSGGSMQEDGISLFWRHPHDGARSMLLKMAFVETPQIHARITGQAMEFFYIGPVPPHRRGQ